MRYKRIKPDPKVVVEALGKALEDENPSVRIAALHTLTFWIAPTASGPLAARANNTNERVAQQVVPVLVQGLQNPLAAARRGAAEALAQVGKSARRAAEAALRAATHDPDDPVRKAALEALEKMGAVVDVPASTVQER